MTLPQAAGLPLLAVFLANDHRSRQLDRAVCLACDANWRRLTWRNEHREVHGSTCRHVGIEHIDDAVAVTAQRYILSEFHD